MVNTGNNTKSNLYIETLIGNSYIEGNDNITEIESTRNSDRNLLVSSGNNGKTTYLRFKEDSNRNVLQNYVSTIDLTIPKISAIDTMYVKNLL